MWPHEVPQLQLALEQLYDSTRRVASSVFGILEHTDYYLKRLDASLTL